MINSTDAEFALNIDWHIADDVETEIIENIVSPELVMQWLKVAIAHIKHKNNVEVGVRIVSLDESQRLNQQYRNKARPTNVLSFESDLPEYIPSDFIGDLAICAQIVIDEAHEQNKPLNDHWAHLCIHGLLHLLGYDHISEVDAEKMECAEISILKQIGIDDPYQIR